MASSRTEQILAAIADAYYQAISALERGDLEAAAQYVAEAGRCEGELDQASPPPADDRNLARTISRHEQLMTIVQTALNETKAALRRTRGGRRALRSYGNRGPTLGGRLSSDG